MASPAFGDPMRALEREAGHVVVELRLIPEILEVTVAADRQLAVMIIFFDVTDTALLTAAPQGAAGAMASLAIG